MARVQVRDLPDAPQLQATVQSGGNFGVAVQRAGSNKLMDLADTLSGFNTALKEYGALGQVQGQIGAQEALTVSDADVLEEIRKTEPDTFLSIQRNKAYRNTLLKRAVNNNLLPSMQSSADELLDLEKYKNQGEFLEAVDGFMKGQWESFSEEVGQDAANSDGGKVLWNAVTGPFKADMLKAYDKKMDDFIVNGQSEELGLELDMMTRRRVDPNTGQPIGLDTAGLQLTAQNREKLLKEAGVNDPKTRSKIIVNGYVRQVDALLANGRYADAERMLAAMNVIQVNKKPIFRTTDAKTLLNPLNRSLASSLRTSSTDTLARQGRRFSNRVVNAMSSLRTGVVNNSTTKEMIDTYRALGAGEDEIQGLIESVKESEAPLNVFFESLRVLANQPNISDEAYNLYYDNIGKINDGFEAAQISPLPPSALNPEVREQEVSEFRAWKQLPENIGKDAGNFVKEENKQYGVTGFTELIEADKEETKGDYIVELDVYKTAKNALSNNLKMMTSDVGDIDADDLPDGFDDTFVLRAMPFINERLIEKAKEVADLPPDQREKALRDERTQAIADEKKRFEREAEAITSVIATGSFDVGEDEAVEIQEKGKAEIDKPWSFDDVEYGSLKLLDFIPNAAPNAPLRGVRGTMIKSEDIEKDRVEMKKNEHIDAFRRSLYNFGYSEWTPESADDLAKARMDADDVKLFRNQLELRTVLQDWARVFQKDIDRKPLTTDEEEIRDLYQKFGIYDEATFEAFATAQDNLLSN